MYVTEGGKQMSKLEQLADIEGLSIDEMLEAATFDSVAHAICKNPGCTYTTMMEPDQEHGWCEECNEGSVVSCLVLAGII
jgi:hypothetical protein